MQKTFQDYNLPPELTEALVKLKFINPTPVQEKVFDFVENQRDLMVCAETGSGKTGAYGIPMIQMILENKESGGLILAPTRELVQQIAEFIRQVTESFQDIRVTSLVGGADMRKQLKALKRDPQVIVATPGRLIDHLKRRSLNFDNLQMLVLDEGDRMLDMGFAPQLDEILKFLPKKRRSLLFTATLPNKVQALAQRYLYQPERINVGQTSLPVKAIKQSILQVQFKEKDDKILDELVKRTGSVIVFARTQNRTNILARHLRDYGFSVDLIHGGRTQSQRNQAIKNFRDGKSRILCATDIAARGLDVPQVEHVINFDLPTMDEDYVHRIGRTARNGASGEALSFVTPEERHTWNIMAKKYQVEGLTIDGPPRKGGKNKPRLGGGRSNSERGFRKRDEGGNFRRKDSNEESSFRKKSSSDDNSWFKKKSNSGDDSSFKRNSRSNDDSSFKRRSGSGDDSSFKKRSSSDDNSWFKKKSNSGDDSSFRRNSRSNDDSSFKKRSSSRDEAPFKRKFKSDDDANFKRKPRFDDDNSAPRRPRFDDSSSPKRSSSAQEGAPFKRKFKSDEETPFKKKRTSGEGSPFKKKSNSNKKFGDSKGFGPFKKKSSSANKPSKRPDGRA